MTKQKPSKINEEIDLTSVRTLITKPSALAKHVGLTVNAIYRWVKLNRIPGEHIVKVANFYDLEIVDLMELTGSDASMNPNVILKSRDTLPTLLKVKDGELTMDQAAEQLGLPLISIKLILTNWGDKLQLLHDTLVKLEQGDCSLDQAALILGVTKYTLHGMRRKYGFAPGALKRTRPMPTLPKRKEVSRAATLRVLAGHMSAVDAARELGISERTIFRKIDELSKHSMQELAHWPQSFRAAYVKEIERVLPSYVEKWLEIAKENNLFIRKTTKYPETPRSWKGESLQRLMIGALLGEASLQEIADSRGADLTILEGLFNAQLVPLGLSVELVRSLPMEHQFALADLLLWFMDRKRKVV